MTYSIPEKKFIDTTQTTNVPETGYLALLNGLNQGTSVVTRIGQKIMVKSINLRVRLSGSPIGATPTILNSMTRVMLVMDNQPNGVLATPSDIIEDLTAGTGVIAPQQKIYISRFKILWDRKFNLINQTSAGQSNPNFTNYDEYYKKTRLQISYADSDNGDITDIITGALYIVAIGLNSVAANYSIIEWFCRIRFYDN